MTTDFGKYTIEIEADAAKLLAGQASADSALKQIENSVKKTANSADKLGKVRISRSFLPKLTR
ncbi:hypothetical protein ACOW5K_027190 [Klebsiella pneumoniae]